MPKWLQSMGKTHSFRSLVLPWAVAFLLVNLVVTQDGGPNATSRFLTMRSMAEQGTFTIDHRFRASVDWSKTPDGHYYSNKAPGPMLLGFPVFFVIDQIPRLWEGGYRDENGLRHYPGYFQKTATSLLVQVVPFILLAAWIVNWLAANGASLGAQSFFLLAAFFGNTASIYMNNYSGHGFTALLTLATLFSLLRGEFFWVGFFSSSALLSDYGFGMQIPALVCSIYFAVKREGKFKRNIIQVAKGGIVPGVLWIWYHTACFGSPFAIANHFQNPVFRDTVTESVQLWGIFRLPDFRVMWELLFGPSRGILYTQPWLYLVIGSFCLSFLAKRTSTPKLSRYTGIAGLFCLLSLAGLLFMNVAFGGWHGGATAGPRYLSGIFPAFALWAALDFDRWIKPVKILAWVLLGFSLFYRGLVFSSTILAPVAPLWEFYFAEIRRPKLTAELRLAIYFLIVAGAMYWQAKIFRRQRTN